MGPTAIHLLRRYLERLQMVAREGRYYIEPFYMDRYLAQGNSMFLAIFNVVVGALVYHWNPLMPEGADRDDRSDGEVAQPEIRTIKARKDGRRQTE